MVGPLTRYEAYSDEYKEACFVAWYKAGCPNSIQATLKILPRNETGRQPNARTIYFWKDEFGWSTRADLLNARAANELETELVEQRKEMLRRHAKEGQDLQELGMKFFTKDGALENDSTALRAVLEGALLERTSLGLSEALTRIMKMTDDQLLSEVQNILKNARADSKVIDINEAEEDKEEMETPENDEPET